jgi:hypothetical protein
MKALICRGLEAEIHHDTFRMIQSKLVLRSRMVDMRTCLLPKFCQFSALRPSTPRFAWHRPRTTPSDRTYTPTVADHQMVFLCSFPPRSPATVPRTWAYRCPPCSHSYFCLYQPLRIAHHNLKECDLLVKLAPSAFFDVIGNRWLVFPACDIEEDLVASIPRKQSSEPLVFPVVQSGGAIAHVWWWWWRWVSCGGH